MGIGAPYDQAYRPAVPHIIGMTVGDIVELAKAGVKVELAAQVEPISVKRDPPVPADRLTDMIYDRWRQSRSGRAAEYEFLVGPTLKAIEHDGKVYVFSYSGNAPPEVIEDDSAIFPSDALLARIHLMMQHAK